MRYRSTVIRTDILLQVPLGRAQEVPPYLVKTSLRLAVQVRQPQAYLATQQLLAPVALVVDQPHSVQHQPATVHLEVTTPLGASLSGSPSRRLVVVVEEEEAELESSALVVPLARRDLVAISPTHLVSRVLEPH